MRTAVAVKAVDNDAEALAAAVEQYE